MFLLLSVWSVGTQRFCQLDPGIFRWLLRKWTHFPQVLYILNHCRQSYLGTLYISVTPPQTIDFKWFGINAIAETCMESDSLGKNLPHTSYTNDSPFNCCSPILCSSLCVVEVWWGDASSTTSFLDPCFGQLSLFPTLLQLCWNALGLLASMCLSTGAISVCLEEAELSLALTSWKKQAE